MNTSDCAKDASPRKSDGTIFVGEDEMLIYVVCSYEARSSPGTSFIHREAALHALHHGNITIWVTDFVRGYCNELFPYDRLVDGIVCVKKKDVFSRELLDTWLWDMCGTGGTFRDDYSSWSSKSTANSASFHRIGTSSNVSR